MQQFVLGMAAMALFFGATLHGAPCLAGSLQSYIDLGATGCSVGGVDYTAFTIVPGQNAATPISPSNVTVTPGGTQFNTTLMLGLNQTANPGDLLELIFRVQAAGMLTAASVSLDSPALSGDGVIAGVLDVCAGGSFGGPGPTGCPTTALSALAVAFDGGPNQLNDLASTSATAFFDIFFDVTLDGGSSGLATLRSATLGVNAVPEPSAFVLMALGIGAMGFARSRRRR